jgi:hypothetical protein
MIRKDYLLRQFEEFGKVMAVILGFKKETDWEKFEKEIETAVKYFTSFELNDLIEKDQRSFENIITDSTHLKPEQIKILADLLYERSFSELMADSDMRKLLAKTNFLYNLFSGQLTANEFNIEVRYRMDLIQKILNQPNPQ